MALHRKYYEDNTIKSLIETKVIPRQGALIFSEYRARFSNDGFVEYSEEKAQYFTDDRRLCKESLIKKTEKKDSLKLIIYHSNGKIAKRCFITRTPILYTEEITEYEEDGSLKRRTTLSQDTDPIHLKTTDKTIDTLSPIGSATLVTKKINEYRKGHLTRTTGYRIEDNKNTKVVTDYAKNGSILFIEKTDYERHKTDDNQYVETYRTENSEGFKEENLIYEECHDDIIERVNLFKNEVETIRSSSDFTVINIQKDGFSRKYIEEAKLFEHSKKTETRKEIRYDNGIPIVILKDRKKCYYNDDGYIDMITASRIRQEGESLQQISTTKDYGKRIGDYHEIKTTMDYQGHKMTSCKMEEFFDPDHILGFLEVTLSVPATSFANLTVSRQVISFGKVMEQAIVLPKGRIDHKAIHDLIERQKLEHVSDVVHRIQEFLEHRTEDNDPIEPPSSIEAIEDIDVADCMEGFTFDRVDLEL